MSGVSTSGRHMPSETDVGEVRGHVGPLKQIKGEKWRTTEMNKPLKWFQGWTAHSGTLISIMQRVFAHRDGEKLQKPGLKIYLISHLFQFICMRMWMHRQHSGKIWLVLASFISDGPASTNVDVLRGRLLVSSLCSLCSSSTYSAQTCFSVPPPNSHLSERCQRSGTVTYPGGGWRTPHLPPLHERQAVPPHLFVLYTPESLILSWITWQRAERAAGSSFQLCFGLFQRINKGSTVVWSHCAWKWRGKKCPKY